MNITFFGAAGEVTGSKHVLEHNGYSILLDCGLHQGRRRQAYALNKDLPFSVSALNAVILSHAHADHCAALPMLAKAGYTGKIYATPATIDIARLIMLDSAKLQQSDYEHLLGEGIPESEVLPPLYSIQDVEKIVQLFEPVEYCRLEDGWHELNSEIRFKFYDAGHILGSAVTVIEYDEEEAKKHLLFTGDLGHGGVPILHDPEHINETIDSVIIECTYGDRLHRPLGEVDKLLIEIITEAVKKRKKIIVPAFALGRTQEIIYILHRLYKEKKIPALPIYIDSPLSNSITEVFSKYMNEFDEKAQTDFIDHHESPFAFNNLHYVTTREESKALNKMEGPMMVIASSGMAEGGRILHHLEHNVWNDNSIIMLTGYQAEHTLGRKIAAGHERVPIFGRFHDLKAQVIIVNEFSAHADQGKLLSYLKDLKQLHHVFLVHGEGEALTIFKEVTSAVLPQVAISIPQPGDNVNLL